MSKKLVYNVGVNDADYIVQKWEYLGYTEEREQIKKLVWICPFYRRWKNMLGRCYSQTVQSKYPTYIGCTVVPEWHHFLTFREWMVQQDWEGKELDKDILFPGNKIYGPDTCVFVDQRLNKFLTEGNANRGEHPIGVTFHKRDKKFIAQCWDVTTGKQKQLGGFFTAQEAHDKWLEFKREQAKLLAKEQSDVRISTALIERYEHYT